MLTATAADTSVWCWENLLLNIKPPKKPIRSAFQQGVNSLCTSRAPLSAFCPFCTFEDLNSKVFWRPWSDLHQIMDLNSTDNWTAVQTVVKVTKWNYSSTAQQNLRHLCLVWVFPFQVSWACVPVACFLWLLIGPPTWRCDQTQSSWV